MHLLDTKGIVSLDDALFFAAPPSHSLLRTPSCSNFPALSSVFKNNFLAILNNA
jgi:hypothetical protein